MTCAASGPCLNEHPLHRDTLMACDFCIDQMSPTGKLFLARRQVCTDNLLLENRRLSPQGKSVSQEDRDRCDLLAVECISH